MKLPKINKQSIQSFFLYHSEKLIIVLALALMGWFFWSGYKTEVFDDTTPQQLSTMADQAGTYITADDSWTQIKDSRLAVESLPIILNDEGIDPSALEMRIPSVAVKSLSPRKDPMLFPVTDLVATAFKAPIYLATPGNEEDPLDDIPFATEANSEDLESEDDRNGGRTTNRRRPPRRTKDKDEEEVRIPGENMPLVQHHETLGLRPSNTRLNRDDRVFLLDGVAVAGVVDVKKQYADYQRSFAFGAGYYPERDHPIYQYVQIERAEVVDGTPGKWQDISERIHEGQTRLYPAAAPEVVAPESYDEILSGVIPPLTLVDYRPLSLHPKVKEREFPSVEEEGQAEGGVARDNGGGLFATDDENQVARRVGPGGTRRSNTVRQSTSRTGSLARRIGSDRKPYEEVMNEKEPTADQKLVRFFDLKTAAGKTYQYRVRLWLSDPNNEVDESKKSGRLAQGRGMDRGMDDMDMEMDDMEMGRGMDMGMSRGAPSRRGGGTDEKEEKVYTKIPITKKMISPDARSRIARAREEEDASDSDRYIYYVSEAYGEGEGDDRFEEIKVPRRAKIDIDALFDLDELRFARPTQWSEPVTVTISKASRSEVAVGDVEPPKVDRVGNFEIPDGEPAIEIAAAVWSGDYHTLIPTKQRVRRGDLLNYTADSHLLNPLTWAVHKAEAQEINTGMVLVDAMGGDQIDTGRRKELMEYSLPGEALVLNPEGEFVLHNDFDDQREYRHSLFIHDDSAEVGEVKKVKDRDRRIRGGGRR